MGVVILADFRHPDIAGDRGDDRSRRGFWAIEVGVRAGGRPRRDHGGIGANLERGFLACPVYLRRRRRRKRRIPGRAGPQFLGAQFRGQRIPFELRFDAVGARTRHLPPIVDAAGRAGRNAGHTEIADVRVDDVVARVMRDRADRAGRLAGVAADADFGVDQVLPDDRRLGRFHHTRFQSNAAFSPLP